MEIKNGYDNKKLKIIFAECSDKRLINLWIEFGCKPKQETLSFITINELLDLKEEIQKAINRIVK